MSIFWLYKRENSLHISESLNVLENKDKLLSIEHMSSFSEGNKYCLAWA